MPGSGERLSADTSVIFGALVFTTNQPSATACNGKSYLYALDVANGGQLPTAGFLANETPWTGKQIASFMANQPVVALLPSGMVEALTHVDDGSLSAARIPITASNKVKAIAWKEIIR